MEVIAIEPFTAKAENGEYRVHTFETFEVISGFGFLKLKTKLGNIIHCPEEYMFDGKLTSSAMFVTKHKDNPEMLRYIEPDEFLSAEDMSI